jgi:hypothetical protein
LLFDYCILSSGDNFTGSAFDQVGSGAHEAHTLRGIVRQQAKFGDAKLFQNQGRESLFACETPQLGLPENDQFPIEDVNTSFIAGGSSAASAYRLPAVRCAESASTPTNRPSF